jgi:S-DNA-T family DNA segregation ATPase FtsK/SpoIIIE
LPPIPDKAIAPIPSEQIIDDKQTDEDEPYVRDERLPGLSILSNEETNRPDEKTINLTAGQIVKTLGEFGIPAVVIGYRIGPTVTQFAIKPGFIEKEKSQNEGDLQRLKVRVAQISALEKDLSLALAAERLRIEAPVPGRPYVGIEVPNTRTTAVRLRPILESKNFHKYAKLPLAIAIGRDVSGAPVIADLAKMPHLLIAGTTGSGKSVCIAALAVCLAMNNLPESLRLIMIDPKMVELQRFKGLPHILGKVETELDRILVVLKWVVSEMERRYKLLEVFNARNIDSYNKKIFQKKGQEPLPKIVVFIDELADLMMSAPEETEHNLVRLAQMARAVGIHLVVATQRPSTEIVTGLIKANFPARIAFNVASSIDSRVILDTVGADHLLGKGDMLFLPPEASAPARLQGVITTDQEIEHLIAYWLKKQSGQPTPLQSPWETMVEQDVVSDRDELIERAIEILRGTKRASTSMLQRRLRIGFPRAARLMEELEEMGVVGPPQSGGRDREVIIDQ